MKKCKQCGITTKNQSFDGDKNRHNKDHCESCAVILSVIDEMEIVLSQPNPKGSRRIVKLNPTITKP